MEIKEIASKFQEAFNLVQNNEAAIMITEQYCLDQRTKFISESKMPIHRSPLDVPKPANVPLKLASEKQKAFLDRLKVGYDEKLTSQEANELIKKFKN